MERAVGTTMSSTGTRFLLSSEQFEMLLALEPESTLGGVAQRVRRDPSVVSRTLSAISRIAPLLEKHDGRWRITPLGHRMNQLVRGFLQAQTRLVEQQRALRLAPLALPARGARSALIVLGAQVGFLSPAWGAASNPGVEARIGVVLDAWRRRGAPIVFCQQLSGEKGSPLLEGTRGCEFLPHLSPREEDIVVRKRHNSAFAGTQLERTLRRMKIAHVVLVGFTTNHCVDSTARSAFDRGFNVLIVADAVTAFDRIGPDGTQVPAAVLHAATLATLHQEYATVIESEQLLTDTAGAGTLPALG